MEMAEIFMEENSGQNISEYDRGWTDATIHLGVIWADTREAFDSPDKVVQSMDVFFTAVAMKLIGVPEDEVNDFLCSNGENL